VKVKGLALFQVTIPYGVFTDNRVGHPRDDVLLKQLVTEQGVCHGDQARAGMSQFRGYDIEIIYFIVDMGGSGIMSEGNCGPGRIIVEGIINIASCGINQKLHIILV